MYVSMYGFVWLCAEAWPMAWLPADDIDYKHDVYADLLIQCCCVCAALCDFVLGQGRRPVGEVPGSAYTPASAARLEGENGTNGRSWRGKGHALVFLVPNCSSQVNYGIWLG